MVWWVASTLAFAGVPVAGSLTAANGQPLDGSHVVTFCLHSLARQTSLGSSEIWCDDVDVAFVGGAFTAALSDGLDPAAVFDAWADVQLAVTVGGVTSAPTPIGWVPYAAKSARSDVAHQAEDADRLGGKLPSAYTYSASGAGLALTGTTFSITQSALTPAWSNVVGRPTAGTAISLAGDQISVVQGDLQPSWANVQGRPTAGAGISLAGTTIAVTGEHTDVRVAQPAGADTFTGSGPSAVSITGIPTSKWGRLTFGNGADGNYAGIGARVEGAGSYLSFGTSNNYAAGITNEAMTIEPSGNTRFNGTIRGGQIPLVSQMFEVGKVTIGVGSTATIGSIRPTFAYVSGESSADNISYVLRVNVAGHTDTTQSTTIDVQGFSQGCGCVVTRISDWVVYGRDWGDNYQDLNVSRRVGGHFGISDLRIYNKSGATLEVFAYGYTVYGSAPN